MRKMFSEKQIKNMSVDSVKEAIESGEIEVGGGSHCYVCYGSNYSSGLYLCFKYFTDKDWSENEITAENVRKDLHEKGFTNYSEKLYPIAGLIWGSSAKLSKVVGIYDNGSQLLCRQQDIAFSISGSAISMSSTNTSIVMTFFDYVRKIY